MKTLLTTALLLLACCSAAAAQKIRVGYFPNITHAQGVIGAHGTRGGDGWFEQKIGDVQIQWLPFNAGPSAMEAMLAGTIDLTYVGPNPALNAYIRSKGKEIRVLAGAAEGGAALVVRIDAGLDTIEAFKGKKVATPQLGNTQDVAARAHFKENGFRITPTGGDVLIIPTANPEQLTLFQAKKIDAAWTVEPWVSRLEMEAGGKVLVEQKDTVTTLLVASTRFLKEQPELAAKFRTAHDELTKWIGENSDSAKGKVQSGLTAEMRREMPRALVDKAWPRIKFTSEIRQEQFDRLVKDAQSVGYLRNAIPLDQMFSGKP